jgi:hypothetical protein
MVAVYGGIMISGPYTYDGMEFPSIKALASYTGVHEKTLVARIRRGMSIEDACVNKDLRYLYCFDSDDGVEKSISQICRDKSKDEMLVRNRLRYGYSMHDALNKPKKVSRQGSPILVHGMLYKSVAEALRKNNLEDKEQIVRRRLRAGMEPDSAFKFDE